MLSLIIILTLLFTVHTGVRRGAVLQGVYTLGYLFSFIYAAKNYIKYVDKLELLIPYPQPTPESILLFFSPDVFFDLDRYFYAGVSFLILLVIGWAITRLIGILCYKLTFARIPETLNATVGGGLALVVSLIAWGTVLSLVAMIPLDIVQNTLQGSRLAQGLIEHIPYFSNKIMLLWSSVPK
ncbi:CvpA family protein [Vagococcus lutrae]|uniref:CvpA family protein n=1 Tax=Vagococcus lutrae TaxID=81947 RepID=UPI00288EA505|nr:CvpA family protein [Vagococcus lutrae]MDT2817076.1 CvpA family protein [Vagococcus lutrae]